LIRIILAFIVIIGFIYYNLDTKSPIVKLQNENQKISNIKKLKISLSDNNQLFSYEIKLKSELSNNQYILIKKERNIKKNFHEVLITIPKKLKMFEKSKNITLMVKVVDDSVLKNKSVTELELENDVEAPKISIKGKTFNNNVKNAFNKINLKVTDKNKINKLVVTSPNVKSLIINKGKGDYSILTYSVNDKVSNIEVKVTDIAGNNRFHSTKLLKLPNRADDILITKYDFKESKIIKWEELKNSISQFKTEIKIILDSADVASNKIDKLKKYSFNGKQKSKLKIQKMNNKVLEFKYPFTLNNEKHNVKSSTDGEIIYVGKNNFLKNYVVVKADLPGLVIVYGMIKETSLKLGDMIKEGQFIGKVDRYNILKKGSIKVAFFNKYPANLLTLQNSLKKD